MHDDEVGYYEDRDTEFLVYGCKHVAHEWGCRLQVDMLTPEQAVAATLGETPTPHVEDLGRLHDELRDAIVEILGNRCDWDQAGVRHAHEVLERAATLGRGTCHIDLVGYDEREDRFQCRSCDWSMSVRRGTWPRFNYCANCGRKVVE